MKIIIIILNLFIISCSSVNIDGETKIGLVEITGPIMSSKEIVKDLNYFLFRDDIKAIVIRVDSPGGAVSPSQEIFSKIKNIKSKGEKPIIVSMGSVAASGGYYVSIGADTIIANPGTITGSIGVIMSYPTINKFMDNWGLDFHLIKSGEYKDSGTPFRNPSKNDHEYFTSVVNELYDQFTEDIIRERGLVREKLLKIADGRVFSGRQALKLGLIDKLGTFEDAILMAGKMVGIKNRPKLVKPPLESNRLIDVILSEVRLNLGLNRTWPIPEYSY